jgi:hypothetical protein
MRKLAIHIFHDDTSSLGSSSHMAERIRQVMAERNVALEVYIFGLAEKALTDSARTAFNAYVDGLIAAGVPVGTCISIAEDLGQREAFAARGLRLEYARDAFVRLAIEGATVVSF